MTPYPADLPIEDITKIVTDLSTFAVTTDRVAFVKAVWELAGYALKVTIGDPTPVVLTPGSPLLSTGEVIKHLESLIHYRTTAVSIPWLAILKWALTTIAGTL